MKSIKWIPQPRRTERALWAPHNPKKTQETVLVVMPLLCSWDTTTQKGYAASHCHSENGERKGQPTRQDRREQWAGMGLESTGRRDLEGPAGSWEPQRSLAGDPHAPKEAGAQPTLITASSGFATVSQYIARVEKAGPHPQRFLCPGRQAG